MIAFDVEIILTPFRFGHLISLVQRIELINEKVQRKEVKLPKSSKWSPEEKLRIVLAGIKGERTIAQICRDHKISETIFINGVTSSWRQLKRHLNPREVRIQIEFFGQGYRN
ncbi:hypothetical protein ES703_34278 [subsurface metagenome]